MRHRKLTAKLGRNTSHRKALLRNLAKDLIKYGKISTTLAKAKALRPYIEKMVTRSRDNSVAARRIIAKDISDKTIIKKLFDEVAPKYAERPGGYTRIVKAGARKNDGAALAVISFV